MGGIDHKKCQNVVVYCCFNHIRTVFHHGYKPVTICKVPSFRLDYPTYNCFFHKHWQAVILEVERLWELGRLLGDMDFDAKNHRGCPKTGETLQDLPAEKAFCSIDGISWLGNFQQEFGTMSCFFNCRRIAFDPIWLVTSMHHVFCPRIVWIIKENLHKPIRSLLVFPWPVKPGFRVQYFPVLVASPKRIETV